MVAAGRRRAADLHDRGRLVLDRRGVPERALGGPEARRRHPGAAGDLSPAGLPLPRPAAVLLRQGGDVVRALQQRDLEPTARQLRPAERRLLAQAGLRGVRGGVATRRPAERLRAAISARRRSRSTRRRAASTQTARCTSPSARATPRPGSARSPCISHKHSREHFVSKHSPTTFSASLTWLGAKRLHPGPHTIRIVALDRMGNRATAKVTFVHGTSRPAAAAAAPRQARRAALRLSGATARRQAPARPCRLPCRRAWWRRDDGRRASGRARTG